MTTYFKVKENVKHNGTSFTKDSIVQGDEYATLPELFEELKGAETQEEAEALLAESAEPAAGAEPEIQPENTWGPKPDDERATSNGWAEPAAGADVDAPVVDPDLGAASQGDKI